VLPFAYIRPLRLVGSLDPGRVKPYGLEFDRLGADFEPTTISVSSFKVSPSSGLPGGEVGATVMFWGGAVTGVVAPDPGPVGTSSS
jgi:hypothetical protein